MTEKILCVDDEENILEAYKRNLRRQFTIETALDGKSGLEAIRTRGPFAVVVSDLRMPGMDGIQFLAAVREETPDSVRVMLTGRADLDAAIAAINEGNIFRFLTKPCSPEMLGKALSAALDQHRLITALDRLKMDFLRFISHELRTALSNMLAIDLLDPHGDREAQAMAIGFIREGYQLLERFIQKGLEYFNWMGTECAAMSKTADLAAVVRVVAEGIPGMAEPEVDLRISSPSVPCFVRGDEEHLAEVVRILLDNALKFSVKEKSISVDLRATAEKVTLVVANRGKGFPPELAKEIFRPFTVVDVMHHTHGTGLNLALASAIVKAYGGTIRATSQGVGKGASFVVEFPALSPAQGNMVEE